MRVTANRLIKFLDGTFREVASLRDANLSRADLSDANLSGADLSGAKGLEQFTIVGEGTLVGYKKLYDDSIAILKIPADAQRLNAYGSRKCRASYAIVTEANGAGDRHSNTLAYVTGERVTPDSFDADKRVECSHGIHFFITKIEAENY